MDTILKSSWLTENHIFLIRKEYYIIKYLQNKVKLTFIGKFTAQKCMLENKTNYLSKHLTETN